MCLFLEFKDAPIQEAGRLRNPAKGRATSFLLNWFGIFFFLVYGNDCMQRTCMHLQMAGWPFFLSAVVFLCKGQRSLPPSCKEASLHFQNPLCFDLTGKGLFLKQFCLAQILSLNLVLKFLSAC